MQSPFLFVLILVAIFALVALQQALTNPRARKTLIYWGPRVLLLTILALIIYGVVRGWQDWGKANEQQGQRMLEQSQKESKRANR